MAFDKDQDDENILKFEKYTFIVCFFFFFWFGQSIKTYYCELL